MRSTRRRLGSVICNLRQVRYDKSIQTLLEYEITLDTTLPYILATMRHGVIVLVDRVTADTVHYPVPTPPTPILHP